MAGWLDWLRGFDLPPWGRGLPPIATGFFSCQGCDALCGGILGKGPLRSFGRAPRCRHAWRPLSAAEFRDAAAARFGVDWSAEPEWWRRIG